MNNLENKKQTDMCCNLAVTVLEEGIFKTCLICKKTVGTLSSSGRIVETVGECTFNQN